MIRGTTPTIKLNCIGLALESISELYVTFYQCQTQEVTIEKTKDEVVIDLENKLIILRLTQEETLQFAADAQIGVQIKAKMLDGTVVASKVNCLSIDNCLKGEVI